MNYYPVFLNIKGRRCVVVGGGGVAERKVRSLIAAGAAVTVISPEITGGLETFSREGGVSLYKRRYSQGDLKGAFLAYAATDDEALNQRLAEEAEREGVLLNVVDDPERCGFIVPSVVERGRLRIAISTEGASPAFARRMRQELEGMYGEEYARFLEIMAAIRRKLLTSGGESDKNRRLFNNLAYSSIPEMIRTGDWSKVDSTIVSMLGEEYSLDSLGLSFHKAS